MKKKKLIENFAHKASIFSGSTIAFIGAVIIVGVWVITGPYFQYSDTWQLVINTGTTVITFLMVFLIQRTQNKDSKALHLKLNELVAALKEPSNRLIDVEDLTEEELDTLSRYYKKLAEMAKSENTLFKSHSIEEAIEIHQAKYHKK